ncbi:MAG: hypothetical protein U1E10_16190 [Bdellovibrionales bacterium]|nr:hypothetical protein [Bdellovibrionales bacterium]
MKSPNNSTPTSFYPPPSLRSLSATSLSLTTFLLVTATAFAKTPLFREKVEEYRIKATADNSTAAALARQKAAAWGPQWAQIVSGNPIVTPIQPVSREIDSLKPGEIKSAHITQSVLAFNDGKAPVSAMLTDDKRRDIILIGEATLEKNSKRILIDFKTARLNTSSEIFEVKASALDQEGTLGLLGEYISGESKFFLAELSAAAASGFVDSSINRQVGAFGNQTDERSLDTNSKKALGSALTRTADRYAEKVRAAPEYSILKGPSLIKVLILEQPKRSLK